jgi:hypothetical protein
MPDCFLALVNLSKVGTFKKFDQDTPRNERGGDNSTRVFGKKSRDIQPERSQKLYLMTTWKV